MYKTVSARKVILTSFLVDLLDVFIGIVVALLTGSAVMVAEFLQGTSDLTSSGLLLIGLKRPKKEVYTWTVLSALTMLFLATPFSFYYGLRRFQNPEIIENIPLAFVSLVINIFSNGYAFWLSVRRIRAKGSLFGLFKLFRTSSLFLTKNTFVLDLMGMIAGIVGLIALILYQVYDELRFDGLGAMGIGIVLGLLSLDLILVILKARKTDNKVPEV